MFMFGALGHVAKEFGSAVKEVGSAAYISASSAAQIAKQKADESGVT